MKTSNLYSLDYRDLLKGLLMAILTPSLVIIQNTIETGELTFNWRVIGMAAVGGGLAYIIKNFFTQSTIKTVADSPTLVTKIESADPSLQNNPLPDFKYTPAPPAKSPGQ